MGKNGGARPGAGRKKGGHNRIPADMLEAKKRLNEMVREHWEPIIQTWIAVGLGDYYVEGNGEERRRVYKAKPDPRALANLMEFTLGKPTQFLDIESKSEGKLEVVGLAEIAQATREILERKG